MKRKIISYLFNLFIKDLRKESDNLKWIENYLRNNGYQREKGYYIKGFVLIKIELNVYKKVSSIVFKHDINDSKDYIITDNFCVNLIISDNYFQNI
jgi:hypothetical protein